MTVSCAGDGVSSRPSRRTLRSRPEARTGRLRHFVCRPRCRARSRGRAQVPPSRAPHAARRRAALSPRGALRCEDPSRGHRHRVRVRPSQRYGHARRRHGVHRDGAAPRREPSRATQAREAPRPGARRQHHAAGVLGADGRARRGHRASRSQARQFVPRARPRRARWRAREDPRLRRREARRWPVLRRRPHALRDVARHADVHVARAVQVEREGRSPQRHLRGRLHLVPAAVRARAVRRRCGRADRAAPARAGADAAHVRARARAAARSARHADAREDSRRATLDGRGRVGARVVRCDVGRDESSADGAKHRIYERARADERDHAVRRRRRAHRDGAEGAAPQPRARCGRRRRVRRAARRDRHARRYGARAARRTTTGGARAGTRW